MPSPPAAVGRENCFLRMSMCVLSLSYGTHVNFFAQNKTHAPTRAAHTDTIG
jgi:hypothetical protein